MTLWPHLAVHRVSTAYNSSRQFILQGTGTPDGRYLLAKLQSFDWPGFGNYSPEQVALYAPGTGAVKIIGAAPDTTHGVTGIVADNHWVIWYDRGLPEVSSDPSWNLYAYNLATGTTKLIAHNPGYGYYPTPQIDQGMLVWDDNDGPVTLDHSTVVIRLLNLATGTTSDLAQKALGPIINWPWVGWHQVTMASATQVQWDEQFMNMQTGETLTVPAMAAEMVLSGTSLVYNDSNSNSTYFTYLPDIHHPETGKQVYIQPGGFAMNDFTFDGRYIGWHSLGNRDLPAVYDTQLRRVIQFPVQYRPVGTEWLFIHASYVVWLEDPNTDQQNTAAANQHKDLPVIDSIVATSQIMTP